MLAAFKSTRIITWDAVLNLGLDWSVYDAWVQKKKSQAAAFLEAIGRIGLAHDKGKDNDSKWLVCDPLAVVAAISPDLVTEYKARLSFSRLLEGHSPLRHQWKDQRIFKEQCTKMQCMRAYTVLHALKAEFV